jgi:hypothetical protein
LLLVLNFFCLYTSLIFTGEILCGWYKILKKKDYIRNSVLPKNEESENYEFNQRLHRTLGQTR